MDKSSKHIDWQKYSERFALSILTDELKIPNESIMESESPDFIFTYERKRIGAEVVEYHRNPKETEARKAYQKSIDSYKGKKGKLTSVIVFDENITNFNRKQSEEQLSEEIDNLIKDESYEAQLVQSADEWDFDSDSELPISVCRIGVCHDVNPDILEQTIRNKEKKLISYKEKHKDIDEFWLIVYVNMHEYDYFKRMEPPVISTSYNRIYLTHIADRVLRIK